MKKVFGMIGLAKRANKILAGEKNCKEGIKCGKALLCILSEDAAKNTEKSIRNSCSFYDVPLVVFGTSEELGFSVGNARNSVLAVTDENFCNAILNIINS
ncbi:MAG: 50S ribosomal protein L7ae [Ruminococcaceae bacterium]|nr:50S ribosomal protein L7ae [Oscillospiraceae bacterium]